jgi:hypothetical protein
MSRVSGLHDLSVEPGVLVSAVVDGTCGAVSFKQTVVAFNFIADAFFSLFLDVMSMFIPDTIFEFVLRGGLKK